MIPAEKFSFFFKDFENSINDFFTHIFTINISFSHIWIVICTFCNFKNQARIDWWGNNICTCKDGFCAIRTKTKCNTRSSDNICFFLHTSRICHYTTRFCEHIHNFMMMCECWSISKIFTIIFN